MLSIGEFAYLGGVSVRMLRHYDSLGLVVPAATDEWTRRRRYEMSQLPRLRQLLALKDLGFSLEEIGPLLDRSLSVEEMLVMLRDREREVQAGIVDGQGRLARIRERLRVLEWEREMPEYTLTDLPALEFVQLQRIVGGSEEVGLHIGGMYDRLDDACERAGVRTTGPSIATYLAGDDGLLVTAGLTVGDAAAVTAADPSVSIGHEPEVARAATILHEGRIQDIGVSWQALGNQLAAAGLELAGPCREIYLRTGDDDGGWTVELQQPVV
ncbi:MerR family transcriptional regulator [Arthrobacter woluwensis]|uniref:MerR family transcriptional regulator n=1 Tax=Arthrobacter woluwensis TaxID=156980 RepID=UPI001AAF6634|nr:MerR family transcriptional regulator [Arthrobacter woluwensis]QTF73478.1 MerR family transcriptional regulator [Arthrobacter woluwensis]